jgi:AraC-like DNA-binding protein
MPDAQKVMAYHVVASGGCWISTQVDAWLKPRWLPEGSVIVFPQGDPHILASAPGLRAPFDVNILNRPRPQRLEPLLLTQNGSGPVTTRLICGFLGCDVLPFNPVLDALPDVILLADGYSSRDGWLKTMIRASIAETRECRSGSTAVLARLSELVFIEAVRSYAESLPEEASNWLTGLRIPYLARAIHLLHNDPARSWDLSQLAKEAGVSRSLLSDRFTTELGMPPMTYLTNWRMQLAAGLLSRGAAPLSKVAGQVGYESEAAFSRAFKRCTGLPPTDWRSTHAQGTKRTLS